MNYSPENFAANWRKLIKKEFNPNPHYEKWGRGRPSQEKRKNRRLAEEWDKEERKKNPHAFLKMLTEKSAMQVGKDENGNLLFQYHPSFKKRGIL